MILHLKNTDGEYIIEHTNSVDAVYLADATSMTSLIIHFYHDTVYDIILLNMNKNKNAFTIVELLVVIVVIGILAAITIVSYSGISNKAIATGLQNDLDSNSKILKMYNVEYGSYPNALDDENCPLSPEKDSKYCLKSTNGTTLQYSGGGQKFDLIDLHVSSGIVYKISENSVKW